MTDSQTKQIQEVQALLAERRRYEQWIAQLDARKESTPPHVYSKVRGDYAARLSEAQEKLASETGVVHKAVTGLESAIATQERQIGEKTDERAEAELRATVGEYTEKEWDKLRNKLDGAIAELSGERDANQRELESLRTLLDETAAPAEDSRTTEPPPAPTPALRVSPASSSGKVSEAPALRGSTAAARPSESAAAKPAGAEATGDVDELAFLRSVLGRTTPYTAAGGHRRVEEPPAPPVAPPPAVPSQQQGPGTARASGASAARTSGAIAAPVEERSEVPEPPLPEPEPTAAAAAETTEPRSSGTFGMPTPRTSEAARSLKCQECGTLNFPTEWYCERCGGELAAF